MNKSKIIYTILICTTIVIIVIGSTYAYIASSATTDKNSINTSSASLSLNLAVAPKYPDPNNGVKTLIPMKDELSEKAYTGYNNTPCIDKNNAAVCYIYEIKIYDYNSNLDYVTGMINLEMGNIVNLSYRLFDENGKALEIDKDESNNSIYYKKVIPTEDMPLGTSFSVKDKEELKLYLMIWLSDNGVSQNATDIGTFLGNVTFFAGSGGKITGKISSAITGNYTG